MRATYVEKKQIEARRARMLFRVRVDVARLQFPTGRFSIDLEAGSIIHSSAYSAIPIGSAARGSAARSSTAGNTNSVWKFGAGSEAGDG